MTKGVWKGKVVPLLAAGVTAYFVYRWSLGFLTAQLNAPKNLATIQVLSYTPLGLLLHPIIYAVSAAITIVCAVFVFVVIRRKAPSTTGSMPGTEEAPRYSWSCSACGEANSAGDAMCKKCGCRANASGKEIQSYKAGFGGRSDV